MKSQNGKGDSLRKGANLEAYWNNYDLAFKKRKTIEDWAEHFNHKIISYDGFREYNQDDLLTEKEYQSGLTRCMFRPQFLKPQNSANHD